MKYSVGDKLLCKVGIVWAYNRRVFTEGKLYTIKKFKRNRINGEMEVYICGDTIYNEDGTVDLNFNRTFEFPWTAKTLDPNVDYKVKNCFHHFYTKKQMRKLKLEEIEKG